MHCFSFVQVLRTMESKTPVLKVREVTTMGNTNQMGAKTITDTVKTMGRKTTHAEGGGGTIMGGYGAIGGSGGVNNQNGAAITAANRLKINQDSPKQSIS